jgi:serine/threonine protein kinase
MQINDGHTPTWYLRAESAREKKSWLMRLSHVHAIVRWLEDFEKVKVLGVGGTGIVYELLHKSNGQRFAMKEMEIKNKPQMQMAISEAEMLKDIMENVSHPNIMHIEKVFQVGSKFYLVFPLCTGGELYEHIIRKGHFTEHDAAIICRDLISGLHALHEHDILHLDIKPENLLFDSMGDNAKIKITDFGLSKLFSDSQANQQKGKFSMQLMEERLKTLAETGELNREKLRGTIGYMAPELILTGHCSKATDVFAAGVVLYILLCGRPPFNSKSNREVLEKTANGQYSLSGIEWDDVSAEAKDLVARMLKVNPEDRISCTDILNHAWIKQLDEDDDMSSTSSASVEVLSSTFVAKSPTSFGSKKFSRKGSGRNLVNALRHLSGHVKQLRSEKFATNVTKLVSLMQHNGVKKSTLTKLYLIPIEKDEQVSPVKQTVGEESTCIIQNESIDDEEMETWFLSPDFRDGFSSALKNISDNDTGRLSLDQFISLLKYIHINNGNTTTSHTTASQNNVGLGPLIISKFIDRDGDGYITADDIFAAQALIMQRSEIFLKVVFRIYSESIWYPGRQLNLRSLLQQTPVKGPNEVGGLVTPGGSRVLTNESNLPTVVEPPKFITGRHIAAVFEKLGYDPASGQKAFTILCEALQRFKTENKDRFDEIDERESEMGSPERMSAPHPPSVTMTPNNAGLAKHFEDMDDGETPKRTSRFGNPDGDMPVSVKRDSVKLNDGNNNNNNNNSSSTPAPPPPAAPPAAQNSPPPNAARMDLQDFVRAAELDDILVQVMFIVF